MNNVQVYLSMYINSQPLFIADAKDPHFLKKWRECEESLTDKLKNATGSADLELVFQNWIKSTWWDNNILQIRNDRIFLREIIMKNRGVDCWYARTIIPQRCFNLNTDFFKRLEQESIRNLIFGESKVQRLNMICYPVNGGCIEYYWVKKYIKSMPELLWVRLAEYSFLNKEHFYLIEILLPELESIN